MKTYYDIMKDISKYDLFEGLLGNGMFSDRLPPVFTSVPFFEYCVRNPDLKFEGTSSDYVRYENMRNVNVPRQNGIPCPVQYMKLCRCIVDHWDEIKEHFKKYTQGQEHKISLLHIRKIKNTQCLFKMSYGNWHEDEDPDTFLRIGKRVVVKADISNCFSSIYTHAVPWAFAGKCEAKRNKNHSDLWFNQIDKCLRSCKNSETHGVLIGPHASNLIAECILVVVDKRLYDKGWRFVRHIDDYSCYVESHDQAGNFLVDLNAELREFDLALNHKKTRIIDLPEASTSQWVQKVSQPELYYRKGRFDYKSAKNYFDTAAELALQEENAAVLRYAIKCLPVSDMSENAKKFCANMSMHFALIYPYLLPLLEEYVFAKYNVSRGDICKWSQLIYKHGEAKGNYEAMLYAVYFAIRYSFKLDEIDVDKVIKSDSCILKLLSFLYVQKVADKEDIRKLRTHAEELLKNAGDMGRNWLFVYEVLPVTKLKKDWKILKENGISFIDERKLHLTGYLSRDAE